MPPLQNSKLLTEHEILEDEIPQGSGLYAADSSARKHFGE
jgi:hypothetical protein